MTEAPLLEAPATLLKRETSGVLSVYASKLIWTPNDAPETEPFEIQTQTITGWQKAKGKPYLRIVSATGASVFEFEDDEVRDAVEKTLQPFISADDSAKTTASHDRLAVAKQQLLQQDSDVRMMYESLVQSGVLSEAEFWRPRMELLESSGQLGARKEQEVGLSSNLMQDILEGQEGSDTVNLTPELIQQIFAERPHVKDAYDRHVPADMDEKEFWLKYCKHQEAVKKKRRKIIEGDARGAKEIDDEFADLFEMQKTDRTDDLPSRDAAPVVNLGLDILEASQGYGLLGIQGLAAKERSSSHVFATSDIAAEINQHGAVVVRGPAFQTPNSLAAGQHAFLEGGLFEDLKEEEEGKSMILNIQKETRQERSEQRQKRTKTGSYENLSAQPTAILTPQAIQSLASSSAKVLMELHYGGEMRDDDGSSVARGVSPADGLPIEILDALRSQSLVVSELLRHFWASYPVNSSTKESRVTKLKDTVISHFDSMKRMRSKAKSPQESSLIQQLLKPVQAQINAAIDKYTTELESRQRHTHHHT